MTTPSPLDLEALHARADADPAQLARTLDAVARVPLRRRWTWLGIALDRASDPDPRVRAAAVRALVGATGLPALDRARRSLDDGEPEVRRGAVEVLVAAGPRDPAAWMAALYHSRADVRALAVERALASPRRTPWSLLAPLAASTEPVGEAVRTALATAELDDAALHRCVSLAEVGVLDRRLVADRILASPVWDDPGELLAMWTRHRGYPRGRNVALEDNVGRLFEAVVTASGRREPDALVPIAERILACLRRGGTTTYSVAHATSGFVASNVVAPAVDALRAANSPSSVSTLPVPRGRAALDAIEDLTTPAVASAEILERMLGSGLCIAEDGTVDLHRAAHLMSRATPGAIKDSGVQRIENAPGFSAASARDPGALGAWLHYSRCQRREAIVDRLTIVAGQSPRTVGVTIAHVLARTLNLTGPTTAALIEAAGIGAAADVLGTLARLWPTATPSRGRHVFVPARHRLQTAIEFVVRWLADDATRADAIAVTIRTLADADPLDPGLGVVLAAAITVGDGPVADAAVRAVDALDPDAATQVRAAARRADSDPRVQTRFAPHPVGARSPQITGRIASLARRVTGSFTIPRRPTGSHRSPLQREAARRRIARRDAIRLIDRAPARIAADAADALLALDPDGADLLADRITAVEPPPGVSALVATLPRWPTGHPARARVLDALASGELGPAVTFRVALTLATSGHPGFLDIAVDLAGRAWHDGRAARSDAERLCDALGLDRALSVLARSPHAAMRVCAAARLAAGGPVDTGNASGDVRAVAADLARLGPVDHPHVAALLEQLDAAGHPDVWRWLGDGPLEPWCTTDADQIARGLDITRCQMIVGDGACGGPSKRPERRAVTLASRRPARVRAESLLVAAELGRDPNAQQRAMHAARPWLTASRLDRAARIAELLAWGERQSQRLLGRRMKIEFIAGSALGYTHLEGDTIHINPLTLLRNDRHGEDIARGLVVHELGHHIYNGDVSGRECWARAVRRGLGPLMNLVCDEHLERNLRARDATYGDHFKRLGAWAFQRADRQMAAHELLDAVGARAVSVLPESSLAVGTEVGTVRVEVGRLIDALARDGSKLSLFLRALRLGLGDRFDDEIIREALSLFGRDFRRLDNPGLLAVTELLADHFRDELALMDVFDVHAIAEGTAADRVVSGRGVTSDDVRDARSGVSSDTASPTADAGGAVFNRGARATFDVITSVQRLPFDPEAWQTLRAEVGPASRRLQRIFAAVGDTAERTPRSATGQRVDRGSAARQLARRDPRMLQRRDARPDADLFVSVIVDCSGSMAGDRMDRAHRFAAVVAAAAQGQPGVDLRVFGFTDRVIYDAGDARRPAISALHATGGNNDAAGLAHAAAVARRSPRAHRLLIMISDGLPTECTTTALRELVQRLTRSGMLCAQVAVAPLRERCFEHYIEVLDTDVDAATRAFARVVERLVRRVRGGAAG